jgi:hypothetical protein
MTYAVFDIALPSGMSLIINGRTMHEATTVLGGLYCMRMRPELTVSVYCARGYVTPRDEREAALVRASLGDTESRLAEQVAPPTSIHPDSRAAAFAGHLPEWASKGVKHQSEWRLPPPATGRPNGFFNAALKVPTYLADALAGAQAAGASAGAHGRDARRPRRALPARLPLDAHAQAHTLHLRHGNTLQSSVA